MCWSLLWSCVCSVTAGDTWQPRFEGAPFEFWVGGEAEIGTSVGQVRVADLDPRHVFFDMFHNYKEGGETRWCLAAVKDFIRCVTYYQFAMIHLIHCP